jgi:uncharacterized protein
LELLFNFASTFLDSFTGLMPYFLVGLISSALVEVFLDSRQIKKFSQNWVKSMLILGVTAIILPVAKGGIIPLVRRLYQKGMPLYLVLFFLTAAPVINFFTIDNTLVAFGWAPPVYLRFGLGWGLALLIGLLFSRVVVNPVETGSEDFKVAPVVQNSSKRERFMHAVLSDCFEWLPFFIGGSLLAAGLRVTLPLSEWMNAAAGAPLQIIIAMLYGMVLSISSTVDCFVVLNWLGRFPLAAIMAFLMAGSIVDVRGLVMMSKGFGFKTSLFWAVFILILVFIGAILIQLGLKR